MTAAAVSAAEALRCAPAGAPAEEEARPSSASAPDAPAAASAPAAPAWPPCRSFVLRLCELLPAACWLVGARAPPCCCCGGGGGCCCSASCSCWPAVLATAGQVSACGRPCIGSSSSNWRCCRSSRAGLATPLLALPLGCLGCCPGRLLLLLRLLLRQQRCCCRLCCCRCRLCPAGAAAPLCCAHPGRPGRGAAGTGGRRGEGLSKALTSCPNGTLGQARQEAQLPGQQEAGRSPTQRRAAAHAHPPEAGSRGCNEILQAAQRPGHCIRNLLISAAVQAHGHGLDAVSILCC